MCELVRFHNDLDYHALESGASIYEEFDESGRPYRLGVFGSVEIPSSQLVFFDHKMCSDLRNKPSRSWRHAVGGAGCGDDFPQHLKRWRRTLLE